MVEEHSDAGSQGWVAGATRTIERYTEGTLSTLYVNDVQARMSIFDIALDLGSIQDTTAEIVRVREDLRIVFSPQLGKVLAASLNTIVAEYERQFGKIPDPTPQAPLELATGATLPPPPA